jgi:hypothetical protein
LILTEPKKTALRGRPATGTAKTSTERGKAADDALLAAGGRIMRARLSPDAATALDLLAERAGSQKEALDQALIHAAKSMLINVDTNNQ